MYFLSNVYNSMIIGTRHIILKNAHKVYKFQIASKQKLYFYPKHMKYVRIEIFLLFHRNSFFFFVLLVFWRLRETNITKIRANTHRALLTAIELITFTQN